MDRLWQRRLTALETERDRTAVPDYVVVTNGPAEREALGEAVATYLRDGVRAVPTAGLELILQCFRPAPEPAL